MNKTTMRRCFSEFLRGHREGWTVELATTTDGRDYIKAHRGLGSDMDYGVAEVSDRVFLLEPTAAIEAMRDVANSAIRQAEYGAWAKTRVNGVVLGQAGSWRKWAA